MAWKSPKTNSLQALLCTKKSGGTVISGRPFLFVFESSLQLDIAELRGGMRG